MKVELNLGRQPIADILEELEINPRDLVSHSTEQLTYKMVNRACKGRKLTLNTKIKVKNALNNIAGKKYLINELFNY